MSRWQIEYVHGDAGAFHRRELPGDAAAHVWIADLSRPAVALGSAQAAEDLDVEACRRQGLDVVRRRSGGGAVLLVPGEIVWIDVVIPPGDRRWVDDVSRAGWWLADVWVAALAPWIEAEAYRGPLVGTAWSRRVCFAGLGPGEVVAADAKLVGVSQRRTRAGARFQTALHRRWRPDRVADLLSPPRPDSPGEFGCVTALDVDEQVLIEAFLNELEQS